MFDSRPIGVCKGNLSHGLIMVKKFSGHPLPAAYLRVFLGGWTFAMVRPGRMDAASCSLI